MDEPGHTAAPARGRFGAAMHDTLDARAKSAVHGDKSAARAEPNRAAAQLSLPFAAAAPAMKPHPTPGEERNDDSTPADQRWAGRSRFGAGTRIGRFVGFAATARLHDFRREQPTLRALERRVSTVGCE